VFGGILDAETQDHNSAENKFEKFDIGENRKKTLGSISFEKSKKI